MEEAEHEAALRWFDEHAGSELTWPEIEGPGGIRLKTSAKGIYKPEGLIYALSVSQRLASTYGDEAVEILPSGEWSYQYHQERETTPGQPFEKYTNQSLNTCLVDGIPVGVMIQISNSPVTYRIMGLGLVESWDAGFFLIRGVKFASLDAPVYDDDAPWIPPTEDTREKARALVTRRYGQPAFRAGLIRAYGGRCAVTKVSFLPVLEAAHIVPYKGAASNKVPNGLLLRSDVHSLFDLGLLGVDTESMCCITSKKLDSTFYEDLQHRAIILPKDSRDQPSRVALDDHRKWAGL